MALDDVYQASTDAALRNRAQLAPIAPRPDPGFSFWGLAKAPFTGAAAGLTEGGAFWSDTLGAFGTTMAAYGTTGVLPAAESEEARRWREQGAAAAREDIASGAAYSSATGDRLRDTARWLGPDPSTASTAENILFGFAKTLTKAATYSVTTGNPLTGAALTGLDEGAAAADELRRQGVDPATRLGVGAVTALATGIGVGLPIAGRTLAGTLGYAAGGGPGLFIAQQQMTRDILNNADYGDLADRYDPFDPVGLAVSTLVPAAFGGLALRGRARAAKQAAERPAQGAGEPAAPSADAAEPPPAARADRDVQDAARVQAAREVVDSWNLADPADVRAANDALVAVMRASSQLADGTPVSIADAFPMRDATVARALDQLIERHEAARADLLPEAEGMAEPGAIRQMREEIDALRRQAAPASEADVRAQADAIRAARPQTKARAAIEQARRDLEARAAEAEAQIARLEDQIEANANAVAARRALVVLDDRLAQMRAERAAIDAPATVPTPGAAAVREATRGSAQPFTIPERGQPTQAGQLQPGAPAAGEAPAGGPLPVTPAAARADIDPLTPPTPLPAGTAEAAAQSHVAARIAELQASQPDAMVRLEGQAEDIPLSEALRQLDDEVARADADAGLLSVAANCAVSAL